MYTYILVVPCIQSRCTHDITCTYVFSTGCPNPKVHTANDDTEQGFVLTDEDRRQWMWQQNGKVTPHLRRNFRIIQVGLLQLEPIQ